MEETEDLQERVAKTWSRSKPPLAKDLFAEKYPLKKGVPDQEFLSPESKEELAVFGGKYFQEVDFDRAFNNFDAFLRDLSDLARVYYTGSLLYYGASLLRSGKLIDEIDYVSFQFSEEVFNLRRRPELLAHAWNKEEFECFIALGNALIEWSETSGEKLNMLDQWAPDIGRLVSSLKT